MSTVSDSAGPRLLGFYPKAAWIGLRLWWRQQQSVPVQRAVSDALSPRRGTIWPVIAAGAAMFSILLLCAFVVSRPSVAQALENAGGIHTVPQILTGLAYATVAALFIQCVVLFKRLLRFIRMLERLGLEHLQHSEPVPAA